MNEEYQVGDLFCATWDEKQMFLLTRISEDVHIICSMTTHRSYEYRKEGIDFSLRKVA